ncbi:hypothetical protein [Dysgonomonas sp. 25]|uniref:hypothetical protein n=1 Tax=Dysgonomonas sp. 25 TaxID=2302933 RepID=UPI0013D7C1E2|nr:hypothetical protein [Dysgonomonas sp. 25]NDV68917.1 hypothetical protein [Dysgonomonas sp. 25]
MEQNSFSSTQNNSTENKPKEEKKSKLAIDEDNDFIFLKNWPPVVRWLLVIPMGLFFFLIVQFTIGFVGNKLMESLNIDFISVIVIGVVALAKFMAFEVGMVGAAPVKRERKAKVGALLAVIPLVLLAALTLLMVYVNESPDLLETYYPMSCIIAQVIGGVLGIIWGIFCLKSDTEGRTKELEASENIDKIGKDD